MRKRSVLIATLLATAFVIGSPARAVQYESGLSQSDARQIYNYTLTMDKVQKMSAATQALEELGKHHPEMSSSRDARSIGAMVQNLQRYPEAVAAINRAGLTPREYTVCLMTLMQSSIAVGFKKSGTYKDYPPELLQQVSRANLEFTEQHWDEIRKLTPGSSGAD